MSGAGVGITEALRSRPVARLELSFAAFSVAEYGVWVTVLVYAYERGGTAGAALVAAAQLLPAGALAHTLTILVQHRGPGGSLRLGYVLQAGSLTVLGTALVASAPSVIVYGASVIAAIAVTATRPAQAALTPILVTSTEQLTAVNALSGWVESACMLAGPALAGVMMALAGPGAAVCVFAACTAVSAAICPARCCSHRAAEHVSHRVRVTHAGAIVKAAVPSSTAQTASTRSPTWTIVSALAAGYVVVGMLDVLAVVLALRVLTLGPSGAGYLTAAFGAGGATGAALSAILIGRARLATALWSAAATWSTLMAILGLTSTALAAFTLLAAAGAARTVLDVSGRTILMRAASADARARLFARVEAFTMFGLASGSLAVPALIAIGGVHAAVEGAAAVLALATFAGVVRTHRRTGRGSVVAGYGERAPRRFARIPWSVAGEAPRSGG